jgi:hypothetical protein
VACTGEPYGESSGNTASECYDDDAGVVSAFEGSDFPLSGGCSDIVMYGLCYDDQGRPEEYLGIGLCPSSCFGCAIPESDGGNDEDDKGVMYDCGCDCSEAPETCEDLANLVSEGQCANDCSIAEIELYQAMLGCDFELQEALSITGDVNGDQWLSPSEMNGCTETNSQACCDALDSYDIHGPADRAFYDEVCMSDTCLEFGGYQHSDICSTLGECMNGAGGMFLHGQSCLP